MVVETTAPPKSWIVVGASRGIGLEFVRQLLELGKQVVAVVRNPDTASLLWQVAAAQTKPGGCIIEQCDVRVEAEIESFVSRVKKLVKGGLIIEGLILNSGILKYPNRASEISFSSFADHLHTNAIGPVTVAQRLINIHTAASLEPTGSMPPSPTTPSFQIQSPLPPSPPTRIVFMSSDSGSMAHFREFEDGFAAYAASKAALNMMARHMAVELKRKGGAWDKVLVMCMHPGEVATDMGAIEVDWEVEGIISAQESVDGMLKVIDSKTKEDSGGFWCWDGREHPW